MRAFFAIPQLMFIGVAGCATDNHPPCRRVSAAEFMRPHTFKGLATDRFIGVSKPVPFSSNPGNENEGRAFKEVWDYGLFHSWAVLWVPVNELPRDYLFNAHKEPNRPFARRRAIQE
jgi:hypothetical protein